MSLTVEKLRGDIVVLAGRRDQAHQDYHQVQQRYLAVFLREEFVN